MSRVYFPAEAVGIGDLKELEGDKCVLNIETSHTAELVPGMPEEFCPRVTMFARKAMEAAQKIQEGALVIFTGVKRNPRTWISETSGKKVETVELIAEGFNTMGKKDFNKVVAALEERGQMFDVDLLTFTAEDAKTLEAEADALAAKVDGGDADGSESVDL